MQRYLGIFAARSGINRLASRLTSRPVSWNVVSRPTSRRWRNDLLRIPACHNFCSDTSKESDASVEEGESSVKVSDPSVNPTVTPGTASNHTFQAETAQLLDIVAKSLYTDREVFIRELISNAADALEKVRHRSTSNEAVEDSDLELEIHIDVDKDAGTITISDTGIGLTEEELHSCLGTIARSGSKAFVQEASGASSDVAHNIIGQFGVGFYSAFMVADDVQVFTKSAVPGNGSFMWESKGVGQYDISDATNVRRGTSVVIKLRDDASEFSDESNVRSIIKRYSNFVNFPIVLNGDKINTLQAIWTMNKNEVSDDEYTEFYRFIANAYDDPMYRLHFAADAPISINALMFVGTQHLEKFGQGRMDPNHSLYSRKVLITNKANTLMPDFLRFVHMVVDSEDIPLNVSRESMQDSNLMQRISKVLSTRILNFLITEAKQRPESYQVFFNEFGQFLKEGVVGNPEHKKKLSQLLRYESSALAPGEYTSFDEYISRSKLEDGKIFYLVAPNRELAQSSPYYEVFKKQDREVLFMYSPLDDFVMTTLQKFNEKDIVSAESEEAQSVADSTKDPTDEDDSSKADDGLSKEAEEQITEYIHSVLDDRVKSVKTTTRLVDSPAIVTGHGSAAVQQMMKVLRHEDGQNDMMNDMKYHLEINANHPIIVGLQTFRNQDPAVAEKLTEQIFDNALISAGVLDDPRRMLGRLNTLLGAIVEKHADDDNTSSVLDGDKPSIDDVFSSDTK